MEFIGGVEGLNFKPISNYNNYIQKNMSFDVNQGTDFENVLNQQTNMIDNSFKLQGGVEVNTKFDELMVQASSETSNDNAAVGSFLQNFSSSVNGGLSSVNESMEAAHKAQEAFAMGEDVSVHDVMIAAEKASLNFNMAIQLRNKLVAAYNEINNVKV